MKESDAVLIDKLHLLEGEYLKRAAVLLFHPDPERFVTGAFIKIGYFRNNADLLYHDEIHGDLFTQVNKTLDLLLTKCLKASISYERIHRVETYPMPEEALREAVLNAIAHKDYGAATPIQISVYDDKLMPWNPGQLPPDWTVERLTEKHSSRPYNPDVANAFFRAGLVEAWGQGIERIMESCRAAGVQTPELRYEHSGLWVEFKYPEMSEKTSEKMSEKTPDLILALLREDPHLTIATLSERIGKTGRTIERNLSSLQKAGRLRRIGPDKGGKWQVLE